MKTQSICQYILHQQRIQSLITLSLLYILTLVTLFSSIHYFTQNSVEENGQFIVNHVSSYFDSYAARTQTYNQDQSIRNLMRYAFDHPDSPDTAVRQSSANISLPSDLVLYTAGTQIPPSPKDSLNLSPELLSNLSEPLLLSAPDGLYYFMPYFNFTQSNILGLLCYRIPTNDFFSYIEKNIPMQTNFTLSDGFGNEFYNKNSLNNAPYNYPVNSDTFFSCTIYYSFNESYQWAVMLIPLFLLIYLFSLLFTFAYATRTAGKIAAPINHLIVSLQRNQAGELTYQNHTISHLEEVNLLGSAYEELLQRIQQLITQNHKENVLRMESKLNVLQERINPHFLFNTLELINSQALLEDADKTAVLTQKLGSLFRYSLRAPDIIPFRQELQYAKDYLFLQDIRYNEILQYSFDIPSSLPNFLIPKLTLQPILENSFQHGFADSTDEPHRVHIQVRITEDHLLCTITDDGNGVSAKHAETIMRSMLADRNDFSHFIQRGEHIGLRNVNARLSLHFQIEQALFISPASGGGTQVEIRLPLSQTLNTAEVSFDAQSPYR